MLENCFKNNNRIPMQVSLVDITASPNGTVVCLVTSAIILGKWKSSICLN